MLEIVCWYDTLRISVRLGEWDISNETDCQNRICSDDVVDVPIKEIILHEDYVADAVGHEHDIALILLEHSVASSKWIKPICLPTIEHLKNKSYDNVPLDVAGWGHTSSSPDGKESHRILHIYLICFQI